MIDFLGVKFVYIWLLLYVCSTTIPQARTEPLCLLLIRFFISEREREIPSNIEAMRRVYSSSFGLLHMPNNTHDERIRNYELTAYIIIYTYIKYAVMYIRFAR